MAFSIDVTDFTYSHLGQGDGLCSQRIYSILQTSDGALWWSTKNNVERYNGVSLFHYLPGDPAAYSDFAGKFIKLCDHCRNADGLTPTDSLFAFDNKGTIYRYNAVHDAFYPYADLRGMVEGYLELNDMLPTTEGVWLATRRGIFFLRDGRLTAVRSGVAANYIVRTRRSLLFCTREGVLLYEGPMQGVPQPQAAMRTVDGSDAESATTTTDMTGCGWAATRRASACWRATAAAWCAPMPSPPSREPSTTPCAPSVPTTTVPCS